MTNLIVISSEVDLENEVSLVNELFHEGLDLLHLRKPHWTIEKQRLFLNKIEIAFISKISIHQNYETVKEFGLQYYHVKEIDRTKRHSELDSVSQFLNNVKSTETLKQVQGDGKVELTNSQRTLRSLSETPRDIKKSTSFHNYNDLQFENIFWDYCFLSPVFDSISKPGYKSGFKNDFVNEGDLNQRVFALGGINKNNIKQVFEKEFFGAAVLGAIWNEPANAVKKFKELKGLCKPNVHTH